ncbi:flagellar biosynthesis protein FlhB [candidate division GN15 bacterium]|nr:flagellar biosynthesis protein FlhB [candidate division GN15 bacterium]
MAEEQSFQEKTEKATPRRRQKAREEGKVAKSMELNSALIIVLGVTSIFLLGPTLSTQLRTMMTFTMANAPSIAGQDATFTKSFTDAMLNYFTVVGPIFAIMVVLGLTTNIAQVGFRISTKALEPKFDKLNIVNGLKRLVSLRSLVTLVRDTTKLLIVGVIGFYAIKAEFESFFLLPDMTVTQIAVTMGKMALVIALKIGAAMLVLAALDYAYQRYEFEKSIKMSKQDIKDEMKHTEGSPEVKSRVRQIQRDMARNRMMGDVPDADVVITNPTHLAVALKYDPEVSGAPMVLAKGERLIAQKIKEIAYAHDIPVIEDKPLARALFKVCEVGQAIPANMYRAVAEVLAYVYRLKGKAVN